MKQRTTKTKIDPNIIGQELSQVELQDLKMKIQDGIPMANAIETGKAQVPNNAIDKQTSMDIGATERQTNMGERQTNMGERQPPRIFFNPHTGEAAGITTADGKTFLGLSGEDVEKISAADQKKFQPPEGAISQAEAVQQERVVQSRADLAQTQIQELAGIGSEDFTQLGRDGSSWSERLTEKWDSLSTQQKVGVGAIAIGAGIATLGLAAPAGLAIAGKLSAGAIFAKSSTAIASFKAFKILGYGGVVYGYITEKRARDLEGQMSDLRTISRELSGAISRGANPQEVREQLIEIEQAMREKGAELNIAKSRSISDRIVKSDAQTTIRKNVQSVVIKRQIVEQYIATGDIDAFNQMMGAWGDE